MPAPAGAEPAEPRGAAAEALAEERARKPGREHRLVEPASPLPAPPGGTSQGPGCSQGCLPAGLARWGTGCRPVARGEGSRPRGGSLCPRPPGDAGGSLLLTPGRSGRLRPGGGTGRGLAPGQGVRRPASGGGVWSGRPLGTSHLPGLRRLAGPGVADHLDMLDRELGGNKLPLRLRPVGGLEDSKFHVAL